VVPRVELMVIWTDTSSVIGAAYEVSGNALTARQTTTPRAAANLVSFVIFIFLVKFILFASTCYRIKIIEFPYLKNPVYIP
jgi:hypothetical protein